VVPLTGMTRACPEGAPAVWRSENGGDSWQRLPKGFPKKDSYVTVLRDGLDIDELKSPALCLGTTTAQLWMRRDGGEKWECLFDALTADQLRESRCGVNAASARCGEETAGPQRRPRNRKIAHRRRRRSTFAVTWTLRSPRSRKQPWKVRTRLRPLQGSSWLIQNPAVSLRSTTG
jgi:hypothetical protein